MTLDLDKYFALSPEERLADDGSSFGVDTTAITQKPQQAPSGEQAPQEDTDLGFFGTVADVAKAPFRGVLGAAENILELATFIPGVDFDIPDYFGVASRSESAIGGFVESMTQFAVPFFAPGLGGAALAGKAGHALKLARPTSNAILKLSNAGKVKSASALQFGRRLARDTAGGAITDFAVFDPSEGRLSDMLVQMPSMVNPVTEFLASDENDTAIEGRLKNMLEGAGLGIMFDSVLSGIRFMRTAKTEFTKTGDKTLAWRIAQTELETLQVKDLKDSFELTTPQARVVNSLISNIGIDRTRLEIGHKPIFGAGEDVAVLNQARNPVNKGAVADFVTTEGHHLDYGAIRETTIRTNGSTTLLSDGSTPAVGYAVSVPGLGRELPAGTADALSDESLRDFARKLGHLPEDAALGTWVDEAGTAYFDVSIIEPNIASAMRMAQQSGEKAIYDLNTKTTIPNIAHPDVDPSSVVTPVPYMIHFSRESRALTGLSPTSAGNGAANMADRVRDMAHPNERALWLYPPGSFTESEVWMSNPHMHIVRNDFNIARMDAPDGAARNSQNIAITPERMKLAERLAEQRQARGQQPSNNFDIPDWIQVAKEEGFDGIYYSKVNQGRADKPGMILLSRDIRPDQIVEVVTGDISDALLRVERAAGRKPTKYAPTSKQLVERHGFPAEQSRQTMTDANLTQFGTPTVIEKGKRGRNSVGLFQSNKGLDHVAFNDPAGPRGVTVFDADGKAYMDGINNPDVSTAIHEVFHVARRQLLDRNIPTKNRAGITLNDIDVIQNFAHGEATRTGWTVSAEEKLADAFESYIQTGKAPSPKLGLVFNKLSRWVRRVYRDTQHSASAEPIPGAVSRVFDRMTSRKINGRLPVPTALLRGGRTGGILYQAGSEGSDAVRGVGEAAETVVEETTATKTGKPPEAYLNRWRFSSDEDVQIAADWLHQELLSRGEIVDTASMSNDELMDLVQELVDDPELKAIVEASGGKMVLDVDYLVSNNGAGAIHDLTMDLQMKRAVNRALTEEMYQMAQKGQGASLEDAFSYAIMRSNAAKLTDTIESMSAEAGRLLQSHNIIPDINIDANFIDPDLLEDPDAMMNFMSEIGGGDAERGMAMVKAEMEVMAAAPVSQRHKLMREKSVTFFQMTQEYWMNSILSGPITATVNALSGAGMTVLKPFEKFMGHLATGRFKSLRNDLARYVWMVQGIGDAFKFGARAFREGNVLDPGARVLENSVTPGSNRALSRKGFKDVTSKATFGLVEVRERNILASMFHHVGGIVNTPSKFLQGTDEFFKQLNYRSDVKARLYEKAWENGLTDQHAIRSFVDESFTKMVTDGQRYSKSVARQRVMNRAAERDFNSGPERQAWIRQEFAKEWRTHGKDLAKIAEQSLGLAREATFTTPLMKGRQPIIKVAGLWAKGTEYVPVLRFLTPFVRTPTNLLAAAFNRNPVFATSQILSSAKARMLGDMSSKNVEKAADAAGRFATGAGLTAITFNAVASGRLSGGGPRDRNQKKMLEASGWQPYSIKSGDKWVSYQRMDPFSTVIGLWADIYEGLVHAPKSMESEGMDLVNASLLAVSRNITNKSYLSGLMRIYEAFSDERLGGTGEAVEHATRSLLASFVPTASSQLNIIDDPIMRETRNLTEAFHRRLYGMSDKLPPRRDLFGDTILRKKSVGPDWLSPFAYSEVSDDVVAKEFARVGHGFQGPSPEQNGIDMREYRDEKGVDAYDRWLELHGKVKIGGLTMKGALKRLMASPSYRRLDAIESQFIEDPRVARLNRIVSRYRARALRETYREYPELGGNARQLRIAQRASRSGRSVDSILDLLER